MKRINWLSFTALVFCIVIYLLPTPKGREWVDWVAVTLIALNT